MSIASGLSADIWKAEKSLTCQYGYNMITIYFKQGQLEVNCKWSGTG
jgi:hypothetical protein